MTLKNQFNILLNGSLGRLIWFIAINVAVFLACAIADVFLYLFQSQASVAGFASEWLSMPAAFPNIIKQPWGIVTYMFVHSGFFHLLFNMLGLYWFGSLVIEYLNAQRLTFLYFGGGIAGALLYVIMYNVFPVFAISLNASYAVGASAAVMAVVAASATLLPTYTFSLILIGPVQIRFLAIIYFIIDIIGIRGPNSGGHIAHIGGAILGFVFVKALQNGNDMSRVLTVFSKISLPKPTVPKLKVSVNAENKNIKNSRPAKSDVNQADVDAILDKISEKGYSNLTKEEKDILFKASNN